MLLRSEFDTIRGDLNSRCRKPRIGLALSAGAARGLAHIGVIQILEELEIPIYAVAGCSMGAYIGALWNYGCDGAEMERLAATINRPRDLLGLVDPAFPPGRGLIRGRKIKQRLEQTIGDARFRELKRPLRIVATRLDSFERVIFSHGRVSDAVHASLAIPGICVPVELNGARFSDGAILDPLPVDVLRRMGCDYTIAVSVIPKVTEISSACGHTASERKRSWAHAINQFATGNFIDTLRRSVLSAEIRLASESGQQADVLIAPAVRARGWHDYRQWEYYIARGREAAMAQQGRLRALCDYRFPDTTTTTIHRKEIEHYEEIEA
ncbi:MAG: NTE family protein [Verrucomicrobiales bacterium]|jgi:NTE family protein